MTGGGNESLIGVIGIIVIAKINDRNSVQILVEKSPLPPFNKGGMKMLHLTPLS
jgi:hypothetical protein